MFKGHHVRLPHFGKRQRGSGIPQKSINKKENLKKDHNDHTDSEQVKRRDNHHIPRNFFHPYNIEHVSEEEMD